MLTEIQLTLITTVLTNLPAVPLIYRCYKENDYSYAVCGFMSVLTSLFYHICDALKIHGENTLFFMNAGQWHRLDNVFVIMVLNLVNIELFLDLSVRQGDFMRWVCLALTLWFQEKGPWQIENTIFPIFIPLIIIVIIRLKNPQLKPTYIWKNIYFGLATLSIAVFFFVRGLDDDHDWIRLNHGLWHFFLATSLYYFRYCVKRSDIDTFMGLVTDKLK